MTTSNAAEGGADGEPSGSDEADAGRLSPAGTAGSPLLETTVRALVVILAMIPVVVAAVCPMWAASTLVDPWVAVYDLSARERHALYSGSWGLAASIIGLKYALPALEVLSQNNGRRIHFVPSIVWAAAVMASSVIVIRGAAWCVQHSEPLDATVIAALVVLWIGVEVIATLTPAALLLRPHTPSSRRKLAAVPADDEVRSQKLDASAPAAQGNDAPVPAPDEIPPKQLEASAPSAPSAEQILDKLREVLSGSPGWRPKFGWVKPDGSLSTSHRQLAEAFKMPKSNLARRLSWLQRNGFIKIFSTQSETRISLVDIARGP